MTNGEKDKKYLHKEQEEFVQIFNIFLIFY